MGRPSLYSDILRRIARIVDVLNETGFSSSLVLFKSSEPPQVVFLLLKHPCLACPTQPV
jgi:hypothetical protein